MARYQEILDRLQELIASGQLRCGDRLPPERTLAETFRVSRTSVREAIRALAERGMLESRQGDGTYVRAQDEASLRRAFEEAFAAQRDKLHEIFELRRVLEPGIAALAARKAGPRVLERLKVIVCDQQRLLLEGRDDTELDARFHLELARAAGNTILADVLRTVHDLLAESRSEHLRTPERGRISAQGHLRVIAALERRDPEACRKAMEEHLETVERAVLGEPPGRPSSPTQGEPS